MQYDPSTEDLFVLLLNDDNRAPQELAKNLVDIIRNADTSPTTTETR